MLASNLLLSYKHTEMKKYIILTSAVALFAACGPKTETNGSSTSDTNKIQTPPADSPAVVLPAKVDFKASGKDWVLELAGTNATIKTAAGDTSVGEYTVTSSTDAKGVVTEKYMVGKEFAFDVVGKEGKDPASGLTYSKMVNVSYKGKSLKGFGGEVVKAEAIKIAETEIEKEPVKKEEPQGRITVNGKWFLQTLNGRKVTDADFTKGLATIDLDPTANRVSGFGGCNNINGTLTIYDGKKIKMEKIISTKMFCEGVPENEYLTALRSATNFSVVDNKLQLKDNTGKVLAVFVRGIK